MSRILVVDDDHPRRLTIMRGLAREGHVTIEAASSDEAVPLIASESPDLILLDLDMGRLQWLPILARVRDEMGPPVVAMSSLRDVSAPQEAERMGAERLIVKPIDVADLARVVRRIAELSQREHELEALRSRLAAPQEEIVGTSRAIRGLDQTLASLEGVDVSAILLTGESGTGKDLIARAIHGRGRRRAEPLIEIDCAGLPESLVDSILFGHERGVFGDNRPQKRGLFEVAGHGTVFLDEVGEIPVAVQAKLLRALESRRAKRVGGTNDFPINATVIAATNRRLEELVADGRFRSDLYYRLNVFPIPLPPLRERSEDIPSLVDHFVRLLAPRVGRPALPLSPEALRALVRYKWPGNVRELRNAIERALILARGPRIELDCLPAEVQGIGHVPQAEEGRFLLPTKGIDLEGVERSFILQALERTGGNRSQAARLLRISRHALTYRLKQIIDTDSSASDDIDKDGE